MARSSDIGARIAVHVGTGPMAGWENSRHSAEQKHSVRYDLHPLQWPQCHEWQMIADTGGSVSLSGAIEMQMGHGSPRSRRIGLRLAPSLSVDVECSQPGDMFGQMRMAFALQRMTAHELTLAG